MAHHHPEPADEQSAVCRSAPITTGLRDALLHILVNSADPVSTADLRIAAHQKLGDDQVPVVHEPVYRELLALQRLGQARRHQPAGRHVLWSLTPTGRHAATHAAYPPAVVDD